MNTEQGRALLPCPFCGGSVSFHQDDEECRDGCHYIECKTCGTFDFSTAADPTNTVEDLSELRTRITPLWNRRSALQSQDREDAERMDFISAEANSGSSLVSDDNGKWAFTDSGIAPIVANGQGFTETVGITAIVDPDMWKDSPREAIDHARRVEGDGE